MGQLFDRILNFGKTYVNDKLGDKELYTADKIINSDDDELKRIIEELNNTKNTNTKQSNNKNSNQYSKDNSKQNANQRNERQQTSTNQYSSFNLPTEVKNALKELNLIESKYAKRNLNKDEIETIKKQYKNLIRQFHPDKFQGENQNKRNELELKTSKINNSYSILKNYYQFN